MTPKSEAIAFRIWQYASPREWNVTYTELAEEMEIPVQTASTVIHGKGWQSRVRNSGAPRGADGKMPGNSSWAAERLARDIASGRVTYDPT